jgi:hypothetical protein
MILQYYLYYKQLYYKSIINNLGTDRISFSHLISYKHLITCLLINSEIYIEEFQ